MSFKDISYLELWRPFVTRSRTICEILVEGIQRNNSVNFFGIWTSVSGGDAFFKIFLIWSSGGPYVKRSGTTCAILVEGIMRNNSVK